MKHIKTRINTKSRAALVSQKVAGVTVTELESALKGDHTALKKLGTMYREGKMAEALMPAITETVTRNIENNKQWNQFLGTLVEKGSSAELAIKDSIAKTKMANMQYVHGIEEMKESYKMAAEIEKGRHAGVIGYNRAKFYADLIFQEVDKRVRVMEQNSRTDLKQLQEDNVYDLKAAQHLLEHGDKADLSLIHKRDYVEESKGLGSFFKRFKNALGI